MVEIGLLRALGAIAHTRSWLATGLTREGLYKAISGEGNPSFATVAKKVRVLLTPVRLLHEAVMCNDQTECCEWVKLNDATESIEYFVRNLGNGSSRQFLMESLQRMNVEEGNAETLCDVLMNAIRENPVDIKKFVCIANSIAVMKPDE